MYQKMPSQRPSPRPAPSLSDRPIQVVYDIEIINKYLLCSQIYALDFRHAGKNLQRLGKAASSDRFHCLSWSTLRSETFHVSIAPYPFLLGHRRARWVLVPLITSMCYTFRNVLVLQNGIIAAGLASGTIEIWDPAKLAAGKGEAAKISQLDKHKGPVSACNVLFPSKASMNPRSSQAPPSPLLRHCSGAGSASNFGIQDLMKPILWVSFPQPCSCCR